MELIKYHVFDVLVSRQDDKYCARVLSSPAGEASHIFTLPNLDREMLELENALLRNARTKTSARTGGAIIGRQWPQRIGAGLFSMLFGGGIDSCIRASLDKVNAEARTTPTGLRVRLRLTDVPELAKYPWEYLYGPHSKFLALSARTPIVRYLDLDYPSDSIRVEPPLRILAMISSPADYVELDVSKELEKLKRSLAGPMKQGLVELEIVEKATLQTLHHTIANREFHIFHYIGHGGVVDGEALLMMETNEGKECRVSAQQLAVLLCDSPSIRLVVLNACNGGAVIDDGDGSNPISGIAQTLISQGIPAVVAMQFEITDIAAIIFAEQFYERIASSRPLEEALGEARKAINSSGNSLEWGTPVLYLRAPDGNLFDIRNIELDPDIPDQPPSHATVPAVVPVDPDDAVFVREIERRAARQIADTSGARTFVIKGPGQVGKSVLLQRLVGRARESGKQVVYVDFQSFGNEALRDQEKFYYQFCLLLSDQARRIHATLYPTLPDDLNLVAQYEKNLGITTVRRFGDFIASMLDELKCPIVLAMDEVDRFFNVGFRSDFFSMLRSWHHNRAISPPWRWLDIIFCTAYELHQLIDMEIITSPFNIGKDLIYELKDYTDADLGRLSSQIGLQLDRDDAARLMTMLGGHPQLLDIALTQIREGSLSVADIGNLETYTDGVFRIHLEFLYSRVKASEKMLRGLREILQSGVCSDDAVRLQMNALGIIRTKGNRADIRCRLYELYFREMIHV